MAATIFVDADAEIRAAYDMVGTILDGGTVDSEYVVPAVLVTQENVDQYIK